MIRAPVTPATVFQSSGEIWHVIPHIGRSQMDRVLGKRIWSSAVPCIYCFTRVLGSDTLSGTCGDICWDNRSDTCSDT